MKFVIVEQGGKQYRAAEGETIEVDRLPNEEGESLTLEDVLLSVEDDKVTVGTPVVKGAKVQATVLNHFKGRKILVFKYTPEAALSGEKRASAAIHSSVDRID